MSDPTRSIRKFVMALDLPDLTRTRGATDAPAVQFTDKQEVVTVGSQLSEFSASVPQELRPLISNSMLLAQLAANKATAQAENVSDWHLKYRDVLANIGWQVKDKQDQVKMATDKNLGVHKAIVPVLTSMLGPAAAATSMVISILKGLQEMDASSPWITLFDSKSEHARGAKFQISYVNTTEDGDPSINLLSTTIKADRTIKQVLFFKFSSQRAELQQSESVLSTSPARLKADEEVIESRVGGFINDFVKNIDI
jgi:hypothetical protein